MTTYRILIRKDYLTEGFCAIFGRGSGTFGRRDNEFYVTDSALQALDKNGIPYSARNSSGRLIFKNRNAPRRRLAL